MKPLILCPLTLFLFNFSAQADLYLRGGLYYASSEDVSVSSEEDFVSSLEGSAGFNVAVGYQLSYFRLEGEFSRLSRDISGSNSATVTSSGNLDRNSVFANAIFEIPATPFFEPYFGVGVGVSQVDLSLKSGITVAGQEFNFQGSTDEMVFSFQLMAGVRFSLQDQFSIYAGYRYLSTESVTINESSYSVDADNATGLFELGVGFGF